MLFMQHQGKGRSGKRRDGALPGYLKRGEMEQAQVAHDALVVKAAATCLTGPLGGLHSRLPLLGPSHSRG
jgi:hypothetical protein